jgi:thiamine-phosphate pyrophosphorylase
MIAAAAGAGVHLTTRSIDTSVIRRSFGRQLLIGVSTHSIGEAMSAEQQGADFVVFGPVFETESKKVFGPPVGLGPLADACGRLNIPVIALGGINLLNYRGTLEAGAAGIAAISLFTDSPDLPATIAAVKGY